MSGFDKRYVGKAGPHLRGKLCRIIQTWRGNAKHNVLVRFKSGLLVSCPIRCLRKVKL